MGREEVETGTGEINPTNQTGTVIGFNGPGYVFPLKNQRQRSLSYLWSVPQFESPWDLWSQRLMGRTLGDTDSLSTFRPFTVALCLLLGRETHLKIVKELVKFNVCNQDSETKC